MDPIAFDVLGSVKACIPPSQRIGDYRGDAYWLAESIYQQCVIVTPEMQDELAREMMEAYMRRPGREPGG